MKYFLTGLILLSITLSNSAYAEKETKNNSFGDKNYKYKSLYKKKNYDLRNKPKVISATNSDENSNPESRKPDNGSQEKSKDSRYLSH